MSESIPVEPDVAHVSDGDLREYADYWAGRHAEHKRRAREATDETTLQREEYSAWWSSKKMSIAGRDAKRRGITIEGHEE